MSERACPGSRRPAVLVAALCFSIGVVTPAGAAQAPAAKGGAGILASAASARAVVAGFVSSPRKVDLHGWAAPLRIDRVLAGRVALGDTIKIAWEELSSGRRVRFAEGDRILVVLDPLPTQSLWRKRFPTGDAKQEVLVVAARGEAFLRVPDGPTLDALEHYLAMAPGAREGASGAAKLAEMVATAHPAVAQEALERLEAQASLAEALGADAAAYLLRAARNSARDADLRAGALRLAAKRGLPGAREAALALTERGSAIRAGAYRALAVLGEKFSYEQIEKMLGDPDAAVRIAGIELMVDPSMRKRVLEVARADASPPVRLAAGRALLARHGSDTIAQVIPLLDDADAEVRSGIGADIGALGAAAVDPLRTVVEQGSERAALAAVLGLSRAGQEGGVALYFISKNHGNETVRTFAGLALGEAPGHEH